LDVEDSEGNVERITYVAPEQKHQVEQELKLWRQERSGGLPGASIQNWEQRCVAIQPAHAITVHRSQGSTFQDVFLDMPSLLANPRRNECLQLIYVAVTRARGRLWVLEP
jgi:ATP-dependent exoDNAse (exonuclease V) alpha subunit